MIKLNWSLIRYIFGLLLLVEAFFMMVSSAVAGYYYHTAGESDWWALLVPALLTGICGWISWRSGRHHTINITTREGFLIVSCTWVLFTFFGMIPFLLSGVSHSLTDAFLETMAGFTTTGCTTIDYIDNLPHGILFWRALTQWLGGLGIVVISLALLPMIGSSATQIFGAETNGLGVDKLRPKIQQTARRLWGIYLSLSVVNALLYWVAGMSVFDAVCHTFSTMASGGFSTHSESLGYYHSPAIEYICIIFLFLTSVNFNLYYFLGIGHFRAFWKNEEFRWFVGIVAGFTLLFMALSFVTSHLSTASAEQIAALGDGSFETTFRTALFHTLTIVSSAGFQAEYFDYVKWGALFWLPTLFLMGCGGSSSSTAGGLKVVRVLVLIKNAKNEIQQALNPRAYTAVRLNGHTLSNETVYKVLAMFAIYVMLVLVSIFVLQIMGLNYETAIGAAVSAFGNTGPAMGDLGPDCTWAAVPDAGKWYLAFCMLVGRLEIFTVMLLFTPMFWKK